MGKIETPFDHLAAQAGCVCFDDPHGCACGDGETVLRAYGRQQSGLPPMTDEQRAWCLEEIRKVEGMEAEAECAAAGVADCFVARYVLNAWAEYCRDKGVL